MPKLPSALTLREGQVLLRDWDEADAPSLRSVCGDPQVCRHTSVPWIYTPAAAATWVRLQHARRRDGSALGLAVARDPGPALGNVNLVRFSPDGRTCALGYWLVPAARGCGLALEASRMLCAWGFEQLGLERIELAIPPGNEPSRRLAEHLGARRGQGRAPGGPAWLEAMDLFSLERSPRP